MLYEVITGLAARYVSGYLLTRPPPGKPRLIGADASHAWVSVYAPGTADNWVDFDPTNNLLPDTEHITLAFGRDFSDISPLRGIILGGVITSYSIHYTKLYEALARLRTRDALHAQQHRQLPAPARHVPARTRTVSGSCA